MFGSFENVTLVQVFLKKVQIQLCK